MPWGPPAVGTATGGEREFGNHAEGGDAPDLVGIGVVQSRLGEPQRAVRPPRNVEGGAAERRDREFGRHAGGGDAPDLVV